MLESVFFFLHYALILLFGILLSAAFAGIRFYKKKNAAALLMVFAACGLVQALLYLIVGEAVLWKIYPLVGHLPTVLLLCFYYRKSIFTAVAAVTSAYICCQPPKWVGMLFFSLTKSAAVEDIVHIAVLIAVGFVVTVYLAPTLSKLFNKDRKSVCIFGAVPAVYYLYDYSMSIYTDNWNANNPVVIEFLPFFLCVSFLTFCFVYYREYESKADAQRKEHIIRLAVEQQSREMDAVRRSAEEVRLLRHDMRHLLSNLAVCIEEGDYAKAQELIATQSDLIAGTKVEHFCQYDIINYILSSFAAKCRTKQVAFTYAVSIESLAVDEILFSSILSNALDNALNAQEELPEERRSIRLLLRTSGGKLLFSVKNPMKEGSVRFVDGLPVSEHSPRAGHGYGSQSIRYMTERLGGDWEFFEQDGQFVVRVVI